MVASSSPELMIGQVAAATDGIRVGSGGVMLPNHSPLRVAEQFKVLSALFGDRIDLGIGRAPGTDQMTAYALRRSRQAMAADDFPEQLGELLAFAGSRPWPEGHSFSQIRAAPFEAPLPPIFLLGSSDFSARLAAAAGLGFAFAAQINPEMAVDALRLYRDEFQPSEEFPEPYAIVSHAIVCADDDEARPARRRTVAGRLPPPPRRPADAAADDRGGARRGGPAEAARAGPGRADDRRLAADRSRPARRAADAQRRRRADGDDERPRQLRSPAAPTSCSPRPSRSSPGPPRKSPPESGARPRADRSADRPSARAPQRQVDPVRARRPSLLGRRDGLPAGRADQGGAERRREP